MMAGTRTLVACALCAAALAPPGVTAAQAEGEPSDAVVLLAPPEVRAEWTAAFQLELAARGTVAISMDVPNVATPLIGDAEAQRAAIARGARTAVWVEARPDAWRLRMISPSAERARVVPVARDADARTVALILVSLLDGEADPSVDDAPAPTEENDSSAPHAASVARAAPAQGRVSAARVLFDPMEWNHRVEREEPARRRRGEPYVHWSGRVGIAGFMLANDQLWRPGGTLRAGIAMRYDGFEAAVLHDLGFDSELFGSTTTIQPFARVCLEGGGATPTTWWGFHAGLRGCAGSVFASEVLFDFSSSGPHTHMSGGAYVAVSFALVSWIRLFVRADVDVGWTDMAVNDSLDVLPAISTFLSFE